LTDRVNATLTRFQTTAENNALGLSAAAQTELNALLPAGQRLLGTGDYRDQSTSGWEFELQSNLTRQRTVRATYSVNRVIFGRFFPLVRPYLASARTAAQAQGLNPTTPPVSPSNSSTIPRAPSAPSAARPPT